MLPTVGGRLPISLRQPRNIKRFLLVALITSLGLLLALSHALAAISLSATAPTTQNFDAIGTAAVATLPTDFKVDKLTTVRTVGTYAAAVTATERVGGANLSTTAANGIYNFGSGTTAAGGTDRAIGFLASGTATTSGNLYAQLVNNTGSPLTGLQISYDVEKYRNGSNGAGFRIQMFYSFDGSSWTSAGTDFLTSFAADANNNGFATAPGATASISNKALNVAVPSGANIYLAWNYSVASGTTVTNAQALAVDNISILAIPDTAATPTPTPTATNPTATATANPSSVQAGGSTTLTVNVTPGTNPASSGITVSADLSAIGGLAAQPFSGSGNTFTFQAGVAPATTPGVKTLPVTVSDAQNRTGSTSITLTIEQPPPPSNHVVISQIYGGGGNSGATYTNDYVELYNPTTTSFSLTGWSLQYASATGTSWTNKQPLGGSIAPGEYYLVRLASGGAVGQPLPTDANITGDINMSATAGKVALVGNGESLAGACPVGVDTDIVDFVGYGTTANCREGSANAPAPANATAIFRKSGGSLDTNQNGSDFVTGTPSPRRTAPVVELGPWVASTEPISDGTNAPHDATITVSFSEPVSVDSAWYSINCAATGLHNDATVAHTDDFKDYSITPNTNFQFGEQCTVTINKDAVHDQDTDDSAPDTDTLFANDTWSFTVVGAGQPAPYPPSVHLAMGNPTNATADVTQPDNYLMEKPTYTLSYNRSKGTPNWVSWHLDTSWFGNLVRVDTFRPDPAIPADWYRVQATDFFATGFDRGHMTPNADRDNENRIPINQETYLMSNMVPQAPDNNQGPWANLENYLRSQLNVGGQEFEIYIVSGPAGVGGSGSNGGTTTTIAGGHVTVPAKTWKVALVLPKGDDDLSRISAATRTIAVIMPNTQGIRTNNSNDWQSYLVSVDQVEKLTGYDFFSNVPAAVQNSIEAGINGINPPGTSDESATTAEDTPVSITLAAVSPDSSATFTYTVSQPAHGTLAGTGANRLYTPAANFHGTDSFTFSANDGHATSNASTVTITVTDVNDAPTVEGQSAETDEDTAKTITLTGSDIDGDSLVYSIVAQPAHGVASISGASVTYTPEANFHGADSFTFKANDGTVDSSEATVSLNVNAVNDAPSASAQSVSTDEDTPKAIALSGTDVETPASSLAFNITTQPAHGHLTGSAPNLSYVPDADYNGADSFEFTVTDAGDGSSAAATSAPASVSITVNPVNDAPTLSGVPSSATINELAAYSFTASAGDVDTPAQPLVFSLVGAPAGASINSASGVFSWTPTEAQGGTGLPFSFKVRVSDGVANTDADVSLNVSEVNQAPSLAPIGNQIVILGDTLTFMAVGADGDAPAQTLSYALSGAVPAGATINTATGAFSWTPSASQSGLSYTFNVVVSDGTAQATSAVVVSVVGPRGIEQGALAQLIALRQTVADRQDGKKLDDAIAELGEALSPAFWVDAAHLESKRGDKSFGATKDAVNKLAQLLRDKKSTVPQASLQSIIGQLLRATRQVAQIAISESAAAGGDPKDIARASGDLAKGDTDAAEGKPDNAVEDYGNAWQRVAKN